MGGKLSFFVKSPPKNIQEDFHDAIRDHDTDLVDTFLKNKNINLSEGLIVACLSGQPLIVNKLVEVGADVNYVKEDGGKQMTPLIAACAAGSRYIIDYLVIEKEADLNLEVANNSPPLAVMRSEANIETKLKLLQAVTTEENVNRVDSKNISPLLIASKQWHSDYVSIINYLISRGANVNLQDCYGLTALYNATSSASGEGILEALLKVPDIDVNIFDSQGMTPLMFLCEQEDPNIEMIKKIIAKGADIFQKNKSGKTAFSIAVETLRENPSANEKELMKVVLRHDPEQIRLVADEDKRSFLEGVLKEVEAEQKGKRAKGGALD